MSFSERQRRRRQNAFGATSPPFIDYLKDILRRYPDGGQILKELIQNADDAGATEVVFIHDDRAYGTQALWAEDLEKYQGPALYAYNNAEFTEDDWRGIQATGRSVKRNDPNKVGRFGIGFNSIYHVTDLPCIFSGKYLGMLDPQEKIFGEREGGMRWSLDDEEDRDALLVLSDQLQPFRDALVHVSDQTWEDAVSEDKKFSGTLFRFSLRNEPSEISDNLYDSDKMVQLFNSFIADADMSLLFLRNVSSVSLIHISTNGSVNVRHKVSASSPAVNESFHPREMPSVEGFTHFKNVSSYCPSKGKTEVQWLVTMCCMKEGHVPELDSLAGKLSFRPQVDLAFPLDQERSLTDGRLSCFLPLPNNEPNCTGLPVHVNACFGLTDNRRHIKWQEEDQKFDEAAVWNELLIKELLPRAYQMIILDAVRFSRSSDFPSSSAYHLWPDLDQMKHKKRWHSVAAGMLRQLLLSNESVFSLAGDAQKWVTLSEAVFLADYSMEPQMKNAVSGVLIALGEKLVSIPSHISRDIQAAVENPKTLTRATPAFVRNVFRKNGNAGLSREDKLFILEYVLSDGKYHELWGLQLLPLSNGTFKTFSNEDHNLAFIDNKQFPRELLPGWKDVFLPRDLRSNTLLHLEKLAETSTYNKIINMNSRIVAKLAIKSLPKDWQKTKGHVTWQMGNGQHPPMQWLSDFWKFLRTNWTELSSFVGMPLVPLKPLLDSTSSVILAKLQLNTTLMFQKSRQNSLSDQIAKVVGKVGGTIIKRDTFLDHTDLETYVLTPSPRNILHLFLNLEKHQVIHGIESASAAEKEELKSYLSSLDSLSLAEKGLLSELPFFRSMASLKLNPGEYISVKSKQAVLLNTTPPFPENLLMTDVVAQCANEADRRLLTLLNIDVINAAQAATLLVKGIEKRLYKSQEVDKIMTWILQNGRILFSQDRTLHTKCQDLSFIEIQPSDHKKTSSFFDPGNKTFRALFEPDFFPPMVFTSTSQMLDSLRCLGMQTDENNITAKDALHVAKHIEMLQVHSLKQASTKADALMKLFNDTQVLSKFSVQQLSELVRTQWVLCKIPDVLNGHQNVNEKMSVFKPEEIRHSKYFNIVGHVMPLTEKLNEEVSEKFGLLSSPPPAKVFENLSALKASIPEMANPDINVHFKGKLHSIYTFMQNNINHFKGTVDKKNAPWLWIHSHFVPPCDVVLSYPPGLDLSSYIERVPEEFLVYKDLLSEFGVRASVSDEEVEGILHSMKREIDRKLPSYGSPSELKVAIAILNWMWKEKKSIKDNLPVPVMAENGQFNLQKLSSTVFCDISREGLEDLREDQEEFYVIHGEMPRATVDWLKIPALSTRILNPEFVGIEQCGQTEPITLRIKNILKEYDEENDLFKELIQNAEDAGATTCKFMLDFRSHKDPPDTLIDQDMSLCHGSCLWAYNDELFTEEDWANIVKVGSASKETKVEKIGKFGLGFNSVYHVTDIPSVLSGKNLLILDPNVTHLKKHIQSKASPGIKLNLFQERLFHRFPGQFKPYQGIFDCDLSRDSAHKFFNGTLIKLPFRTHEEALSSEVSKKVFEGKTIAAFSQHLTHNSEAILLFLRNISKVSLEILPENSWTPPCAEQVNSLFKVSRKVVCTIPVPDDTPLKTMQDDSIKVLLKIDAKFEQVIDCLSANIIEVTKKYQDVSDVSYWLVHSCFGMQTSLNMFQKENKQKFPLPVGSIAVPLKKEPQGGNWLAEKHDSAGQVFCFLPLSIYSGLPVHINGFFAVTSNRKGLWDTGVKHEWNKALLQDAVTGSYIFTLSVLKEMSKRGELQGYHYYMFWPDKEKVSTSFQSLTVAFYSAIAHNVSGKAVELFSDGKTWCSIEKARFLHPKIAQNKDVGQIAMKEFLANQRKPYLAVPLPEWVRNSFSQTDLNRIISARTLDWVEFYEEIVFNNLSSMDPKSRNALVLHAIDMNDKAVDNLLKSHPCIPAIGCKQLQFIRSLVNPSGKVACLYDPEEGRFLKGTSEDFCCPKRIQRLTELGMLSNFLSLEDIIERAETITRIWQKNQKEAYKRIRQILDLTREHLSDETSPHWNSLRNIAFIPACLPKITGHDKNTCTALKKPVEVYSFSCQYLVNMMQTTVDQAVLGTDYDSVLRKLGVLENPPLLMVLQQLEHAHLHFRALDEDMLNKIAFECYGYLDEMTKEQTQSEAIFESAKSFPFVLIEGKFVNVKSVAKKVEFEAKPYLYCLPNHFSKFKNLWQCVGMQKHFTSEQLVGVLQELSIEYQSRELSHCDLDLCLRITKRLYEAKDHEQKGCLLPDENGVLRLSHKLFYNDSPWMPVSENAILCHNLVPRSIALHFGVQTTRHHTLQNHLVAGFSPFVKEFGQHEELTVRIKNIIQAYPSKKDILKELIQNADDAQATEIHFVWDKRKHSTMKTFGEKWDPLQGPALCVYNNKVFSDADLEGIQRLGEGGKHEVQGKTGKYGLGFNSVYHLTDCPSILTGDQWLCISDPNLKYVEGGTKLSPGCMYSLGKEFRDSFPDVYNTFLPSNFKLEEGTMFRLPLRTEEMAKMSEISKNTVNSRDIEELSTVLTEDPEGLILFLRHIRKIQFHEICTGDSQMTTRFSAEITLSEKCDVKKTHFQNHVQNSLDAGGPIESLKTIYNISILSSIKKKSEWIVAEQFGSLNENTDLEVEQSIRRVPQAAVAACLTSITEHPFTGRVFCSLPLPCSTGLPVHVNGNFEVDSSRRDLWKEDGKSKKTEWNESLKLDIIAPLYADLLHYICASGKKSRFSSLKYLGLYLDSSFLWFFPEVTNRVGQEWHGTVDAVFKSINERDFPVIPILSTSTQNYKKQYTVTWSSVTKGEPTDAPHFTINEHSESFLQTLEDIGMNVVPFSHHMTHIFTSFERAQVNVGTVSPFTVRKFLKTKPLNDPATTKNFLPLPINQTLIKDKHRCETLLNYCMEDICKENCNTVCGLPLLLTEDQMLRYFHTDSPRLLTKFCELFQGHEEDFADYGIDGKHIFALQQGNFLKAMTIPASEMYLKPKLEDLLQNCKFDPECKLYVPEETTRKWLQQLWRFFNDQIKSPVVKDKTNQAFLDIKELFFDSPVVPVICSSQNNKHFLKTMRTLSSVVSFSNPEVRKILCKLGFMTLDLIFFHDFELSQHFDPELLDTSNGSAVLDQLSLWQHFQIEQIANEDLDQLLYFLQSGLGSGQNTQDNKRKLMSLPLFETVQGRRQRIDAPWSVFILDSHLTQNFPDLYSIDKVTIFLKNSDVNLSLSKKMNITVLNDLDYYVKFILPSVHKLSDTLVLNSVQMLLKMKHYPKFEDYHEHIIFTMKSVKFIRDVFGNLQMASYFYDENEPLHQAMLPKERFVPEKFWDTIGRGQEKPAKKLLRELGLKYVVSDDEMIEFAHTIESDTKGNMSLERLKHKSECLFASLLKRDVSQKLLKTISTIKFVVPLQIQQDLCKYYKPFAGEREFVAIKGSLIEKDPLHQRLIWTTVPILPSKNCSLQRQIDILKAAGALEQPEPQHVIDNLRNICQGSTKENIQTRAGVFRQSYGFLQTVDFSAQPLTDLPVVLVENDTELVKPKQTVVVLRDSIDFRPYLFRLPTELVRYEEFFKKIGVRDTASTQQYSTVLQEIYRDCIDKQEMNPNQIKTCKRAVQQLFLLIEENANEKTLEIPQPLYLPATDGRLYESSSLYFNDTYFRLSRFENSIEKKLKLLEKLKKCYLCRGDQKLVQLLPHNVRPKMLSEVTTKTLVESSMEPCVYGECCEFSGLFENQLSSSYFMHGLVCILREHSEALPQSDIDAMFLNFNKIKFICCERLETMILLHQEPLDNSTAETQLYVKREQEGCTFYIKHSDDMSNSKVKLKIVKGLAKQINELLKKALRTDSLSVLEDLLMCENMEDVQEVLETNTIRNIAHTDYGQCRLPDPGTPIPEEWIDSLDMNFLNNFEVEEYVGFKNPLSEEYVFAVVAERVKMPLSQGGLCSQKYKIKIGVREIIEVSSLDLYQFKRGKRSSSTVGSCRVLVPSRGSGESEPPPVLPQSMEEIQSEIDKCLEEIWTLSEEERRKGIRRLYLRWHPDKNPDCLDLATEACKYLQKKIEELERGGMTGHRYCGPKQGSSQRSSAFRGFYQEWDQEASRHRRGRERFNQRHSSRQYNFWSFHEGSSGPRPNPNPEEAHRWHRQAKCDLAAARNDTGGTSTEWCLYKVHQAVEKALIGAEYKNTGLRPNNSTIASLAQKLSYVSPKLNTLPTMVHKLNQLGVDAKKTQYPNYHTSPGIPNDQFNSQNLAQVLDLSSEIITKIYSYIHE
ncbi:LOW QUALITY PROTEIN: sacsin-like [Anguilla anguilla]|uniref:LOW QUALITY PROTEIN: sacsin-like n=1 Tax=Anguilla anguilla TaxID=7936 RepID=UPI0015B08C1F|nr:LOW QUALITY PROTEIN: sacsin-like [Anguilla anguilla]